MNDNFVMPVTKSGLDELLAPYEQRPACANAADVARRREGLRVGWELNRLQGGAPTATGRRLDQLLIDGRIDATEHSELAKTLALRGLLA